MIATISNQITINAFVYFPGERYLHQKELWFQIRRLRKVVKRTDV